jgi:hypothetical protein
MNRRAMDLYDVDTGESLTAYRIVTLDGPIELRYCKAARGRIVQVRRGPMRIHYFYDEPMGQTMIQEDARRNGVSLQDILAHAPAAKTETVPVVGQDGSVVLYDMYVNGEWHGSRRTLEQCELYFRGR